MPTYRRRRGHDAWHWCRNCSNYPTSYPTSDYEEVTRQDKPTTGELCNQCLAKEKDGSCQN